LGLGQFLDGGLQPVQPLLAAPLGLLAAPLGLRQRFDRLIGLPLGLGQFSEDLVDLPL